MTAYAAIANSEIAVGAPLTNSLMTKVRDNPLAIQENDVTAPEVAYATTAGTASTITSQGALATLDEVGESELEASLKPWVELDTQTITTSTTSIDMDGFSSSYYRYKIVLTGIGRLTSSNIMYMRVKVAGSSKTDSQYSIDGGALTTQAAIGSPKTTAILAWNVEVDINNPTNTINNKLLHVRVMADTNIVNYHVSYQNEALALSGLQFYTSGGGPFINGGLAKLYGLPV